MKKLLVFILVLSVVIFSLSGCAREYEINEEINTSFEGVYITIEGVDQSEKSPILEVVWHNDTDSTVCFGLWYTIEYLDGDEWKNIQIVDFAIPEIACVLGPGESANHTYATKYFNMLREGNYRIRTEFYVQGKEPQSGSTGAGFFVKYIV